MKIDVICSDGSPLGVTMKSLWGEDGRLGVGGAEVALLTLCEGWHNAGHTVRLYNSPAILNGSPFEQHPKDAFYPGEPRDVVIIFRSPNPNVANSTGLKVWFSTDQYTIGDFSDFARLVDKIVCISSHHAEYFEAQYNIKNTTVIDLPVRTQDFENMKVEKIPKRMIFTSVPDRGLTHVRDIWPVIKSQVPDASLVITSDYRLWGAYSPLNEGHRSRWIGQEDVRFLGAIPRRQLLDELLVAEIMPYFCTYDELFCISVAEAQACGVYPITTRIGSLSTTNMGTIIEGDPLNDRSMLKFNFGEEVIRLLNSPDELRMKQDEIRKKAIERFCLSNILRQWDERVFA